MPNVLRNHAARVLLVAALPAAVAVAGCASGSSAEEFDRRVSTYVGRSEADLIAGLGVPSRTYEADGRRLLQYDYARPSSAPVVYPSIGLGFGSWGGGSTFGGLGLGFGFGGYGASIETCAVTFDVQEGRVRGFERRGDACAVPAD